MDKLPVTIGARQVYSVTPGADNTWIIDLENDWHDFSYPAPPPNTGSNAHIVWKGGGVAPIYPIDPKRVQGFDEPDKTMGSPAGGASRGDTVSFPSATGFEDWRLFIREAIAHGPSTAAGWGDSIVTAYTVEPVGYFTPAVALLGSLMPPPTGLFVDGGGTTMTRVVAPVTFGRPSSLASGQYYVDEEAHRIYFSPANDALAVIIRFTDSQAPAVVVTENYTIDTTVQLVCNTGAADINYTEWTDATIRTLTRVATGETVTGYTASDVGGKLAILFNGNDAGRLIRIRLEKPGTTASPGNGVAFDGNYESYGRNRDRVVIHDDTGFMAANYTGMAGSTIEFQQGDGVFMGPLTVEWLETNGFERSQFTASQLICEGGRGNIFILDSWFTGKTQAAFFLL